jgi:hypothetical protein
MLLVYVPSLFTHEGNPQGVKSRSKLVIGRREVPRNMFSCSAILLTASFSVVCADLRYKDDEMI